MTDRELMVYEHKAVCPYCGQMMFVELAEPNPTEDELSAEAVGKCDCPGATQERGMRATEKAIQRVLGEGSTNIGFDYALDEVTLTVIRAVCGHILADQIDNVTLREPHGDTVGKVGNPNGFPSRPYRPTATAQSKGLRRGAFIKNGNAVKIRRSCKKQAEM